MMIQEQQLSKVVRILMDCIDEKNKEIFDLKDEIRTLTIRNEDLENEIEYRNNH